MKISDLTQAERAVAAEVMSYALGAIKFELKRLASGPRGRIDAEAAVRVVQRVLAQVDNYLSKDTPAVAPAAVRDQIRNLFAELADDDAQEDAAARAKFSEVRRAAAAKRFGTE